MNSDGSLANIELVSEWEPHYMEFEGIRKLIFQWQSHLGAQISVSRRFHELLDYQLGRVNAFATSKVLEAQDLVVYIASQLTFDNSVPIDDVQQTRLLELESQLDFVVELLVKLDNYLFWNFEAFCRIVSLYDKGMKQSMSLFFQERLLEEEFTNLQIESLLVPLSECFSLFRGMRSIKHRQQEGGYSTIKYLIKRTDRMRVRIAVLRHLPIYATGSVGWITPSDDQEVSVLDTMASRDSITEFVDSVTLNSVYLDSESSQLYSSLVQGKTSAGSVKVRWRGIGKPGVQVIVELCDVSTTQQFSITWEEVGDFLRGSIVSSIHEKNLAVARKVLTLITEAQLTPVCKSVARHMVFEDMDNPSSFRICIDSGIFLSNESSSTTHLPFGDWTTLPLSNLPCENQVYVDTGDLYSIPYDLFEVRIGSEVPSWITELEDLQLLLPVPGFSKFLTGSALFKEATGQPFPKWFSREGLIQWPGQKPRPQLSCKLSFGTVVSPKRTENIAGVSAIRRTDDDSTSYVAMNALEESQTSLSTTRNNSSHINAKPRATKTVRPSKPRYVPVKIEPKTYFANERTFISWLHQAILLMTMSIALYSAGDAGRKAGHVLFCLSGIFLIYALAVFLTRAKKIALKQPGILEDRVGPYILVCGLFLAIGVNIVLMEHSYRESVFNTPVKSSSHCVSVIGGSTRFASFGSPSGSLSYIPALDRVVIPSHYDVNVYHGGVLDPTFSFKVPNLRVQAVASIPGNHDGVWLLTDHGRSLEFVEFNGTSIVSSVSLYTLLEQHSAKQVLGMTYDSDRRLFWLSLDNGFIVAGRVSSSNKYHVIPSTFVIPSHLYGHNGTEVASALTYDPQDDVLYLLVMDIYRVIGIQLESGKVVATMKLPGRTRGWKGLAIRHPTRYTSEAFLLQSDPPRLWKSKFSREDGFACQ